MKAKMILGAVLAAMILPLSALAQEAPTADARYSAVLSRLQSMGHGYYSEKEWAEIDREVKELTEDAVARRDGNAILRTAIVNAMVFGDMRRRYPEATLALNQGLRRLQDFPDVDASPLYVKQAEVFAEAGDAPAIEALIQAYKASPYYKPQPLYWSGGTQPGDPLVVARPNADGTDSLPLTVMEKALLRARSAPGGGFPDATLTDLQGRTYSIAALRGNVVLLDFFVRGWKAWEQNLPALKETWGLYNSRGFVVISVCLEPNAQGLESLDLPWPVVAGAPELTRTLGIFGETSNYLLDAQGAVVARNLRGTDLSFAVSRLLGR